MRSPAPAPPIAAPLILPAIFLSSNYVPMPPYALIFSVFSIFFGSFLFVNFFFFFSPFQFLLILLVGAFLRLLILPFLDPFGVKIHVYTGATRRTNFFVLFFCINIMSPAPPIAAALILMALLMIYGEETPQNVPVWQEIRQSKSLLV